MTFEEAIKLAETEFELKPNTPNTRIVKTGLTYNGANGFCVMLYDKGDHTIITDIGETKEVLDEVAYEEWEALCLENGFEFNHWHIEKPFNSIEDLHSFISFLDTVSDKFFDIDN